jgi:hypothetical protein
MIHSILRLAIREVFTSHPLQSTGLVNADFMQPVGLQ